jgi:hypothetical protein
VKALHSQGWRVVTVWECELRNRDRLAEKLSLTIKAGFPFFQDVPVQMAAEAPTSYTTGEVSDDKRRSER